MIISQVMGGLGNQMFQYALGRTLSLQHDGILKLDIDSFANYEMHQGFELSDIFNCSLSIANKADIENVLNWRSYDFVKKILMRQEASLFRGSKLIVEPYFHYWPKIKNVPRDCYLVGYWQSDKYFQSIEHIIRTDFIFKSHLKGLNSKLAEQISHNNSVSLHVRRGDYVENKKTNATHGSCSLDYYRKAIQLVSSKIPLPHFFIFSDDISWAKKNLKLYFPHTYVDNNSGAESYNDMHLMSLCQNHIIANSSFSWWGAWLNPNKEKIVVAPNQWFLNKNDVADLFPQGWYRL